ncbi:MAG: ABC transporter permease [Tissierellia bacterium]|jgi:simple sugar transport system permease protein|nr:ABC transporter permease [Tissierellia bacterium]
MIDKIKSLAQGDNLPRFVITVFLLLLFVIAAILKQPIGVLLGDSLVRYGMNGILVLAMVPAIQAGTGPNFGLPIGIVGGLLGMLISMEFVPQTMFMHQWVGLIVAIIGAIFFGAVFGWLYGQLLNRVKGSEMVIATYTAFSFVALMCIAWLVLPFKNRAMIWPIGKGLKNTITMENTYGGLLNDFLSFKLVENHATGSHMFLFNKTGQYITDTYGIESAIKFQIPTGMILFFLLFCYLVYLFINSRTGVAMRAVGDNPKFAESSGINVNRSRLLGVILSTVLGAIGIIIYSQGFGYMQLYNAPQTMAFGAVAAILIGGASAQKAKISHVLIGAFLFNSLLVVSLPVANELVPAGGLSDVFRVITTYGVILYALAKVGGKTNA